MTDPAAAAREIIFAGGRIIDAEGEISAECRLSVAGDRILEIRDFHPRDLDENAVPGGCRIVDCRGRFVSPGLVNLHAHTPMSIFKGIAEDANPDDWFNRDIWPYESKMEAGDVEIGSRLAIAEMIDYGVSAFADHYFMADRICRVVEETGIRADIAPTLFGMSGDFEKHLEESAALAQQWNGGAGGRLALRLGPHSPYTCTVDQLTLCAQSAENGGLGIHIHVEDGPNQVADSIAETGMTPFEVLQKAGICDRPLIAAHAYWIRPEERRLLGTDSWIAVCMMTYMKLGYPPGPILANPGDLPLAIGTDGAASSNCLNPLEQARLLALAGKSRRENAEDFSVKSVWTMLMNGHRALDFGTGRLEPGRPADFVVWNLNRINTAPAYNPLAALIYSADARNVEHVLVAGKFLKENYLSKVDPSPIVAEAKERAERILQRGRGKTKLIF